MGIINVTQDSFYSGSRHSGTDDVLRQADRMISEGADFIDIGAASSRPGATPPSESEEIIAIVAAIEAIRSVHRDIVISADTYRSVVARAAIQVGADLINDISAGTADISMLPLVAEHDLPIIIMHMQGEPGTMQDAPQYKSVLLEVTAYLSERLAACRKAGINDIIIDPGFGFGKLDEHNYRLLRELGHFKVLGVPLLAGLSRKSMIQRTLNVPAEEALNGTTALHMTALMKGAGILRVHDVKEAVQCVKLYKAMQYS
ncbi:UNVERIFIED_CONTAM: hypothetical protein GTU68_042270 [Idotea baltica]|nr:hypothetical protein [Idotea baltica]